MNIQITHPHIAKLLVCREDLELNYNSKQKVKWKCADCNQINCTSLYNLSRNNSKCKHCKDCLSLGEQVIYLLLEKMNIEFLYDKANEWSNNKRYDFYIPHLNIIIETHGEQHYKQTNRKGARTLEEEQSNDKYKYDMAIANGIPPENYIVIDCRKSEIGFIVKNITNSKLLSLLKVVNFDFSELDYKPNLITLKVWSQWSDGKGVIEISNNVKVSKKLVRKYLELGNLFGKVDYNKYNKYDRIKRAVLKLNLDCIVIQEYKSLISAKDYKPIKSLQITTNPFEIIRYTDGYIWMYKEDYEKYKYYLPEIFKNEKTKMVIYQVDSKFNLINIFKNSIEASSLTGFDYKNIRACVSGINYTYKGYYWMTHEDFIKLSSDEFKNNKSKKKYKSRKIVKLDTNNELLETYDSISQASEENNVGQTSISKCLRGKRKTSGGFKWMYIEDYYSNVS